MLLAGVQNDDLYAAAPADRPFPVFVAVRQSSYRDHGVSCDWLFRGTLEQIVILAVLMPIVASMGGNAGTQTMTVAVRALATKELTPANALRVTGKEALVGLYNGLLFALLIGGVAWYWADSFAVGAIMSTSMLATLVIAALAGMGIPLALARTGVDPAVASGVILTTVTDVVAFSVFLGLAASLLL